MPASAVEGENARMRIRVGHRRELKAAVVVAEVVAEVVVRYDPSYEGLGAVIFGQVELRVVWRWCGRGWRPKNAGRAW